MIVIGEQERHRGWNKCDYNHKRAAGSITAAVDHEHPKRIQSQVGPICHPLERITSLLQIRRSHVTLEVGIQVVGHRESEGFGAKAQS